MTDTPAQPDPAGSQPAAKRARVRTPAQPDPAGSQPAAKRTPVTERADWWGFGPPAPGEGPPPMSKRAAKREPERAVKPEPEPVAKPEPEPAADDTSGPAAGAESAADASDDTTVAEDTPATFADAFAPPRHTDDDGGGFTQDDYDALAAEYADGDEEVEPTSRREARYRTRLRDTEARLRAAADENVDLQNRVEALQQAEALRLASDRLADPEDLFRDSHVEAVLDTDGTVDPQRVSELVDTILREHPHWEVARPATDPHRLKSGAARADQAEPPSWTRAFAPRAK